MIIWTGSIGGKLVFVSWYCQHCGVSGPAEDSYDAAVRLFEHLRDYCERYRPDDFEAKADAVMWGE